MATPPTFVASREPSSNWASSTTPKTTAGFNASVGEVLAVFVGDEADNGTDNYTITNSGTAQTWTEQPETTGTTNADGWAQSMTAVLANAFSSNTVTCTRAAGTSTNWFGFAALHFSGSDGIGANGKTASTGSATPSISITTTTDNAAIAYILVDFSATTQTSWVHRTVNSITPSIGNGLVVSNFQNASHYSLTVAYISDAGTAGAKTVGVASGASGGDIVGVAVEVKGAAAGPLTVTVDPATLTLTGVDATAAGTGSASVTVDFGALTLAGVDPAAAGSGSSSTAVDVAALTLAGVDAVAATGGGSLTADPATLSIAGVDVSAAGTGSTSVTVDTATLTLVGSTPTASGSGIAAATADPAVLTLTGSTPAAAGTGNAAQGVDVSLLVLGGMDVSTTGVTIANVDPATLTLTGQSPTLDATGSSSVTVDVATLTLAGLTPALAGAGGATVVADAATLTLTGVTPLATGAGGTTLLADAATLTLVGAQVIIAGTEPSVLGDSEAQVIAPVMSTRSVTRHIDSIATVDGVATSNATIQEQ